jgi:hypothetical protein
MRSGRNGLARFPAGRESLTLILRDSTIPVDLAEALTYN